MTICLFSKGITVHCLSIVSVWWLVVINIFAPLPPTVTSMSITSSVDLREKTVGFLGVGKITSCVVKGLCSPAGIIPKRIYLSPRNKDKATALQSEFPDNVEIASSNEDVVSKSDIVFIGLLPQVAKEILPSLDFTDKEVISMMATIDIGDLLSLTKRPVDSAVRTVPLPSSQYREGLFIRSLVGFSSVLLSDLFHTLINTFTTLLSQGPCLVHPPIPRFLSILSSFSTPIPCIKESEMKPMVALTGHISRLNIKSSLPFVDITCSN